MSPRMAIILTALRMCARFFADGRWEFGDGRPVDTALIRRAIEAAEQLTQETQG